MSESSTALTPAFRWYQWKLSTWFVLVAILGWAFAITPPYIVITDTSPNPGGKPLVSTMTSLKPHYFGPLFALSAFVCWKEIANLPGFGRPAFRRRAKRFALALSVFAVVAAIAASGAVMHYGATAGGTTGARPDVGTRLMLSFSSLAFYSSAGFAIGLIAALALSAADHRMAKNA